MSAANQMKRRIRKYAGLMGGLFVLAACMNMRCFPGNVAWLPDSSGFLYSSSSGRQVERFDLAGKTAQVLISAPDAQACTPWFSLSPDGKWFALARLTGKAVANMSADESLKPPTSLLQVYIYDLTGKLVQQSPPWDWPTGVDGNQPASTGVLWAPKDQNLLIYGQGHTAIYDLVRNHLIPVGHYVPFDAFPIQPAGKGFVVQNLDEKADDKLCFVDWEGHRQVIKTPATLPIKELVESGETNLKRWQGDTLVFGEGRGLARLDTTNLEVKLLPQQAARNPPVLSASLSLLYLFDKSGVQILHREAKNTPHQIEVVKPPATQPVVLAEMISVQDSAFPSPDGNLVALRGVPVKSVSAPDKDQYREQILVINGAGELVLKIDVPE